MSDTSNRVEIQIVTTADVAGAEKTVAGLEKVTVETAKATAATDGYVSAFDRRRAAEAAAAAEAEARSARPDYESAFDQKRRVAAETAAAAEKQEAVALAALTSRIHDYSAGMRAASVSAEEYAAAMAKSRAEQGLAPTGAAPMLGPGNLAGMQEHLYQTAKDGPLAQIREERAAEAAAEKERAAAAASAAADEERRNSLLSQRGALLAAQDELAGAEAAGNTSKAAELEAEIAVRRESLQIQLATNASEEEAAATASARFEQRQLTLAQDRAQEAFNQRLIAQQEEKLALEKAEYQAQAALNAQLVEEEVIRQRQEAEAAKGSRVYGRGGQLGNLGRNFGLGQAGAATLGIGALFGMEANRAITEYSRKLDEQYRTLGKETSELQNQAEKWSEMALSATTVGDKVKLQQEIFAKLRELQDKQTEVPIARGGIEGVLDNLTLLGRKVTDFIGLDNGLKTSFEQDEEHLERLQQNYRRLGFVLERQAQQRVDWMSALDEKPVAEQVSALADKLGELWTQYDQINQSTPEGQHQAAEFVKQIDKVTEAFDHATKAQQALKEGEINNQILEAKIKGETEVARQMEEQLRSEKEIDALRSKGIPEAEAKELASRTKELREQLRLKELSGKADEIAAGNAVAEAGLHHSRQKQEDAQLTEFRLKRAHELEKDGFSEATAKKMADDEGELKRRKDLHDRHMIDGSARNVSPNLTPDLDSLSPGTGMTGTALDRRPADGRNVSPRSNFDKVFPKKTAPAREDHEPAVPVEDPNDLRPARGGGDHGDHGENSLLRPVQKIAGAADKAAGREHAGGSGGQAGNRGERLCESGRPLQRLRRQNRRKPGWVWLRARHPGFPHESPGEHRQQPLLQQLRMNAEPPSPPDRAPVSITLEDGSELRGFFAGYQPASLLFDTADGRRAVPFALIPGELQECFPFDPSVIFWRHIAAMEAANARNLESAERLQAIARTAALTLDRLEPQVEKFAAEMESLRAENAELKRALGETE